MADDSAQAQTSDTISAFDRSASGWSSKYQGDDRFSDRIRRFTAALEGRLPGGGTVLDYGCGSGNIACALAASGYRMSACDISPKMVEAARTLPGAERVSWSTLDPVPGAPLRFDDGAFDAVISSSVIEYVADPGALLDEFARILKPDGLLAVTVPSIAHPKRWAQEAVRWSLRVPLVEPLITLAGKAEFARLLKVSINRWPVGRWKALLDARGFALIDRPTTEVMMVLLVARRKGPAGKKPV